MKTLAEATGVVSRPPSEVLAEIEKRLTGGAYPMKLEVDLERGMVAVQGGWWYRAEYFVTEHPAGSRVTHRVLNVALRGAWGVPLANRFFIGFRAEVERGFAELLAELGGAYGDLGKP